MKQEGKEPIIPPEVGSIIQSNTIFSSGNINGFYQVMNLEGIIKNLNIPLNQVWKEYDIVITGIASSKIGYIEQNKIVRPTQITVKLRKKAEQENNNKETKVELTHDEKSDLGSLKNRCSSVSMNTYSKQFKLNELNFLLQDIIRVGEDYKDSPTMINEVKKLESEVSEQMKRLGVEPIIIQKNAEIPIQYLETGSGVVIVSSDIKTNPGDENLNASNKNQLIQKGYKPYSLMSVAGYIIDEQLNLKLSIIWKKDN
jgi:hypothetical protein